MAYNFDLFTEQIKIFPKTTSAIALLIAGIIGVQGAIWGYGFADNVAMILINLVALVGGKAMWLFAFYPMIYGTKYPGSLLVIVTFITTTLMVFVAGGFYIIFPLTVEAYSTPPSWVLAFFGIFFFLSFYASFKFIHWICRNRRGFRFFRRQIELED